MSFREKSAWVMALVMIVTGAFYANLVASAPQAPVIGPVLPYVLLVVVLSVVAQIILVAFNSKEADVPADEREKIAIDRAGHWSGLVLGVGVISSGIVYILLPNGTMFFHHVLGALIVAQLAEYIFQIYLFRRPA